MKGVIMFNDPIFKQDLPNGEILAYRKAGQKGPHLVLLHGNLSSSMHYSTLMERLKNHFQLIAIDMRGFGDSTYHQPITSLSDLAEDVWNLLDILKISDCFLMGWSTGGGVGLEMAAMRPNKIKTLILLSSIGIQGYTDPNKVNLAHLQFFPMLLNTNRAMAKWNPALQKMEFALKNKDRKLLDKVLRPLYQYNPIPEEEFQLYLHATCQQQNYSDIFLNLFTFNMSDKSNGITNGSNRYQLITAPIMIIHGDKDKVVSLESALLTYQYLKKQATIHILDAGHSILTDQPEQLDTILKRLIQ